MLTLYTAAGAIPLKCDDYYIREISSGLDELIFSISIWDEAYPLIQEETTIREHSGEDDPRDYLVKAIDGGAERAQIKAQIDLDAWKGTLTLDYNSGSKTVLQIVQSVAPTGWAVVDQSGITYKRTVSLESATALDVLDQCRSTFVNVTYRFNNVTKVVTILSTANGQNLGAFATRDLNLKENNYKGKSTGFITRLYAYGKDGMSFADINDGKPYVDNNTYSDRVICGYWKDERYTVAANLLADAQARLAEMAVPARSYECNVVDLAAVNPQKYGFLDFALFTVVSLIDQTRSGAKIEHRVIERWRYPYYPAKNKVTLATVASRIQNQVAQAINNFNNPNSVWQQQQRSAQQNAIESATEQITGAKGGNMRAIYDSSGNWTELVVMNTEDILTASKLWRFNLGGFGYSPNGYNGPYTTAITMNGQIVADFITTGTLDASLATVTNLDASNITAGTLSAARIAAHSLAVDKISGTMSGGDSNSWGIDFTNGTLTIGTISANKLTAGTIDASVITVTNLNGSNITSGTISADRIDAAHLEVAAANITGQLTASQISVTDLSAFGATIGGWTIGSTTISKTSGSYKVALAAPASPAATRLAIYVSDDSGAETTYPFSVRYNGALTATNATISGTITATSGTIGGVTISNGVLSGISSTNIASGGITGGNIASSTITGSNIGSGTIENGNVKAGTLTNNSIYPNTLTTGEMNSGINTNLGWGASYGAATQSSAGAPVYLYVQTLSATGLVASSYLSTPSITFGQHGLTKKSAYDRDGNLIYYVAWL